MISERRVSSCCNLHQSNSTDIKTLVFITNISLPLSLCFPLSLSPSLFPLSLPFCVNYSHPSLSLSLSPSISLFSQFKFIPSLSLSLSNNICSLTLCLSLPPLSRPVGNSTEWAFPLTISLSCSISLFLFPPLLSPNLLLLTSPNKCTLSFPLTQYPSPSLSLPLFLSLSLSPSFSPTQYPPLSPPPFLPRTPRSHWKKQAGVVNVCALSNGGVGKEEIKVDIGLREKALKALKPIEELNIKKDYMKVPSRCEKKKEREKM